MKKTIQFTVTVNEKEMLLKYANVKGFQNVAALAKVALYQYIRRHPENGIERHRGAFK